MATVRLFGPLREAAGVASVTVEDPSVGALVATVTGRYGPEFGRVLSTCKIWVNGNPATFDTPVTPADEVALLPPVSGG